MRRQLETPSESRPSLACLTEESLEFGLGDEQMPQGPGRSQESALNESSNRLLADPE